MGSFLGGLFCLGLFIAAQIYRGALAICEPSAARTRRLSLAQRELALSLAQRLGHTILARQQALRAPTPLGYLEHLECSWQPHIQGRGAKKRTQRAG